MGTEPMPHTSVALTAQYLNVRQRKLGTILPFILSISCSMKVRTQAHCPWRLFLHGSFCPRRRRAKPGHFAVSLLAAPEVSLPDGRDLLRRGCP
jgi:hypothetical protein